MAHEEKMRLEDWLDDLCVRFIINLPAEDLSSVARICFQVEEAHWFYEDFIRTLEPTLPNMSLRTFCIRMFQHCPLLASFSEDTHIQAFEEFMKYKVRIPVRGAILLNQAMDSVVLVRGWKKTASWSFPRGKINKDEDDLDCAIREVFEETGFDARSAGLVDTVPFSINLPMRDQQVLLYVIPNVPEDTIFEPKTRNEIGGIRWYKISDLPAYRKKKPNGRNDDNVTVSPNKFYMVAPFLVKLRDWIRSQRKQGGQLNIQLGGYQDDVFGEDDIAEETAQLSPPTAAPVAENLNNATRELHRLLRLQPATEGLQVSPSNANPEAAAALMSILQPKAAVANGQPPANHQYYPHTPFDHTFPDAPQPPTPHHHHPAPRLPPFAMNEQPPQFPIMQNANHAQHQGYSSPAQAQMTSGANGQPNILVSSRQHQDATVQILHPQPQPPQVQRSLLMRGMLPTPSGPEPAPETRSFTQTNTSASQVPPMGPKAAPAHSAHAMHLLNVLKGSNTKTPTSQQSAIRSQAENKPLSPQFQQPPRSSGYAQQYGTMPISGQNNMELKQAFQPTAAAARSKQDATTETHRSTLLGMFQKAELPKAGSPERLNAPVYASQPLNGTCKQPSEKSVSMASALEAAAQENGRPVVANPELNLPFGALSIASRHKPGQLPLSDGFSGLSRTPKEITRNPLNVSQPSPTSLYSKPPPKYIPSGLQRVESADLHPVRQRVQPPGASAGLPYSQGASLSGTSPIETPSTAALPIPNLLKPRQAQSAEQKSSLLSLFGTAKTDTAAPSKGKELAVTDQNGLRSRVASVTSVAGAVKHSAPLNGISVSRPASKTPLSPSDQAFLWNLVEQASKDAQHR